VSTATDPDVLSREISLIQDLLQAEPDAKCKKLQPNHDEESLPYRYALYLCTGALDSLVHYSIFQLEASNVRDHSVKIVGQIESWLERLKQVDPYRHKRYDELGKPISTCIVFSLSRTEPRAPFS
jgi:hypothetical protein